MESGNHVAVDVAAALRPGASAREVAAAAEALVGLVERGFSGDDEARARYQSLLLEMHVHGDREAEPARSWLASLVRRAEDRFIDQAPGFQPLSVDAFRARVDEEIAARTRVKHPLSRHLFEGAPTPEQVRYFLRHHWIRSHDFYRLLAELALRFDDIEDAAVFYRNLYGEAGGEAAERSHPSLLARLIRFYDIPLEIDYPALHVAEKAYLNNRLRCVRHDDVAWGLALLYAVESVSRVNHARIHELLVRQRVPDEYCEFHRLHGSHDEIDTEELWQLIARFAHDGDFQRTFMRSLMRHFEINRKYFDVLWENLPSSPSAD